MEISLEKNTHTHIHICVCVCVCILEYWNGLPFKEMATHFSILAGEFHAQRSLVDIVHGVAELDMTEET